MIKLVFNISYTVCIISIFLGIFKCFRLTTMQEILICCGKKDALSFFIVLLTFNSISNIISGFSDNFNLGDLSSDNYFNLANVKISEIFKNGNFSNNFWITVWEYIQILTSVRRQFTLHSSFFFLLSLFLKNLSLPLIQNFRASETPLDEIPTQTILVSFLFLIFGIYLESNLAKNLLHYSKRRFSNCFLGSELNSFDLILKGLCVEYFLVLVSNICNFEYGRFHFFYLRLFVFFSYSASRILSLRNIAGVTKKGSFQLYIYMKIFQSVKEAIEVFSEFNRFRKTTININYSMKSPTEEELNNLSDQSCIICRDEITGDSSKKLSCGHIFHIKCLQNWLISQYRCPTCRTEVSSKSKDPLNDVEKSRFESSRTKVDLISLVLGCRSRLPVKSFYQISKNCYKSLPSLNPDLASIVFFKKSGFCKIRSQTN